MAGTTVLFVRSVVDLGFDIPLEYGRTIISWRWGIEKIMFLTMFLVEELHAQVVVLQRSDSISMPDWLLSEVDTEA